ncbi:hypothetical protein [Odoribacter lunatus]|uniref:hypothetical protein n=1 Tax=Odoribacter lunatus TaxID=2941335 RepID=UPI00203D7415|nr:hypothetical protein [Odoribacter lunatus]
MSETKIVIPCDVLKRITPLLQENISYEPVMFIDVFRKMEAIFLIGKVTDDPKKLEKGIPYYMKEEEMDFYFRKRKPEDFTSKYDPQDPYALVYEFGNNIELTTNLTESQPTFSIKDFDKLWDSYKLPHDDYYYAFLVLIAVYTKYIHTYGAFDCEIDTSASMREETLRLLSLLWKPVSNGNPSIKISYNGKSLTLDNQNGWLKRILYTSLGENMDLEAIEKEIKEKYTVKSKTGRKTKKKQCNLLLSAYNLIHRTSLKKDKVALNDMEALFLIDLFKYLKLHSKKKEVDFVYMRALLSHYQEEKSVINWWIFE